MTVHSVPAILLLIGGVLGAVVDGRAGFACVGVAGLLMLLGI